MEKLERCGFCGSMFRGERLCSADELNALSEAEINDAPLGYCPNAGYEDSSYQPPQRITRDMAIDAGDLSLEGEIY